MARVVMCKAGLKARKPRVPGPPKPDPARPYKGAYRVGGLGFWKRKPKPGLLARAFHSGETSPNMAAKMWLKYYICLRF